MRIYLPANLEENVFWIYLDSPLLYAGVTLSFFFVVEEICLVLVNVRAHIINFF